jgi:ubiquinone/menaquinone biosynthesis C-methylase UbiE
MLDEPTIAAYNQNAPDIATWQREIIPARLRELIRHYFHPGAATADIGCGSGRDVAWLVEEGFPTTGYDASTGMLEEAGRAYPALDFRMASLPELEAIPDAAYTNVLANAVLMHLPQGAIPGALHSLARILMPGGRLLLTYRNSRNDGEREDEGRLYTAITLEVLKRLIASEGLNILHTGGIPETKRAGITWNTAVAEKMLRQ